MIYALQCRPISIQGARVNLWNFIACLILVLNELKILIEAVAKVENFSERVYVCEVLLDRKAKHETTGNLLL